VARYLEVLDRALEDRRLAESEQADLAATAQLMGLDADRVRAIHDDYVGTLVAFALRDGVLSDREHADLGLVASALGVSSVNDVLVELSQKASADKAAGALAGRSVCFTGTLTCRHQGEPMTRESAERLAREAGMVVRPRVTRSLDVLVVADPDSISGKARQAREYGTRVIAEPAFWPLIGVEVT